MAAGRGGGHRGQRGIRIRGRRVYRAYTDTRGVGATRRQERTGELGQSGLEDTLGTKRGVQEM